MNQKFIQVFTSVIFLLVSLITYSQDNVQSKNKFFEELAQPDTSSGARVILHQDKRIEDLITGKRTYSGSSNIIHINGYRVQVFSSNVQRTAKNEAFSIEKAIREVYPEQGVYVNYTSPFWKVRVGDFPTLDQAQAFRNELVKVFPQYRSETYPVREKINISSPK